MSDYNAAKWAAVACFFGYVYAIFYLGFFESIAVVFFVAAAAAALTYLIIESLRVRHVKAEARRLDKRGAYLKQLRKGARDPNAPNLPESVARTDSPSGSSSRPSPCPVCGSMMKPVKELIAHEERFFPGGGYVDQMGYRTVMKCTNWSCKNNTP